MNNAQQERLIGFLMKKMGGPCRRDGAIDDHEGCKEAEELITIVNAET